MFDLACAIGWSTRVFQDYQSHEKDLGFSADQFLKCKSQALAEQASGNVYFFIPKGVDADPNSAVCILHHCSASLYHPPTTFSSYSCPFLRSLIYDPFQYPISVHPFANHNPDYGTRLTPSFSGLAGNFPH